MERAKTQYYRKLKGKYTIVVLPQQYNITLKKNMNKFISRIVQSINNIKIITYR